MAIIREYDGHRPQLAAGVFIAENAALLGQVELGENSSVWFGAVLRGDVGRIRIGARTNIQDNATIHMTYQASNTVIGDEVIVGHNAVIHGADIRDRALIGMGAIVMDNAVIGRGAWVAAGSVVPARMQVPPNTLVRGAPAKAVRQVSVEEAGWAASAVKRYLTLAEGHSLEQK